MALNRELWIIIIMAGIFKKLFRLQLNANNNPIEDYLTEIFCHCLKENSEILKDFLQYFKIYNIENEELFGVFTTQYTLDSLEFHHSGSRPDMVLIYENSSIFIENKISSLEGYEQLKRYAEHLDRLETDKKCLVYITKNYEAKTELKIFQNCSTKIDFIQIRWYQIFHFLKKYNNNPIVFELLKFLKEIKLSMNNQFTPSDLIALSNFSNVQKLMNETMFGDVKKMFKNISGSVSQNSSVMTELRKHDRYIYTSDQNNKVWTGLGYWMNSNNEKEYPELGIVIEVAPRSEKRKEIITVFKDISTNIEQWESYSLNNDTAWAGVFIRKSLQSFLASQNQIIDIQEYFKSSLQDLKNIFDQHQVLKK